MMKKSCAIVAFAMLLVMSCDMKEKRVKAKDAVYIKPTIDRRGHFRQGHIRMPVSKDKNAISNQSRSRYYYQSKGKYKHK